MSSHSRAFRWGVGQQAEATVYTSAVEVTCFCWQHIDTGVCCYHQSSPDIFLGVLCLYGTTLFMKCLFSFSIFFGGMLCVTNVINTPTHSVCVLTCGPSGDSLEILLSSVRVWKQLTSAHSPSVLLLGSGLSVSVSLIQFLEGKCWKKHKWVIVVNQCVTVDHGAHTYIP